MIINKDKLGALIFLTFSLAYLLLAFGIKVPYEKEVFTARTLPLALGGMGIVISLLMLLLPSSEESGQMTVSQVFSGLHWKPVALLTVWMIVYGAIITPLGFLLSTLIFLNGGFWILGERRIRIMLYMSLPLVIFFWLVLTKLLGIYLAPGSIFAF